MIDRSAAGAGGDGRPSRPSPSPLERAPLGPVRVPSAVTPEPPHAAVSLPAQVDDFGDAFGDAARGHGRRPRVTGKFLSVGADKLLVRGVTYGAFAPNADGDPYPDRATVDADFARMEAAGINAIRTYTAPPGWLLDLALARGVFVMAGIAWEQHVAFLDHRGRPRAIEQRVRAAARSCAGHPALLCHSIGNEIPASIVRWHGRRRVERFLRRLYDAVKEEDPDGLVTYVNFPSTEYLDLGFVDLLCFNVYLEQEERLRSYLARLHNLAGDRPLVMAEIGLDSRRNGEVGQARALDWQVRAAFEEGCAGAFVFAWTDEWHVGGRAITDWDFGLTDRARAPKPALLAVRRAFEDAPHAGRSDWPRVSVVVCSYNGERTIRRTCEALSALEYPDYEVIVVDDGSTDSTAAIAAEYGVCVISTQNQGLSSARNTGWRAATGNIVAYTDDDAFPDRDWLRYLVARFCDGDYAAVGGPNIAPSDAGIPAWCVDQAPGNPTHVLLSDREAEHIPGCNCAVRRDVLEVLDGFDPRFRVAGDDVDLCWRIRDRGLTIGFSAGAMVWHQRRDSIRAYWRQQRGYGRAEAQLERKWPERHNAFGHMSWRGRLYGAGPRRLPSRRARIYHGRFGGAPFQSVYEPGTGALCDLPSTPEWQLMTVVLAVVSALGLVWPALLVFLPLGIAALAVQLVRAFGAARRADHPPPMTTGLGARALVLVLNLLQPVARLWGRSEEGLTPLRRRGCARPALPLPRTLTLWTETWRSGDDRLSAVERRLRAGGAVVVTGGDVDRWEHEVRAGVLASARVRMCLEEHGAGRQLARFRLYPHVSAWVLPLITAASLIAVLASMDGARAAAVALMATAVAVAARAVLEASRAMGELRAAAAPEPESISGEAESTEATLS
jgi:O-antigen biosynthesis protein